MSALTGRDGGNSWDFTGGVGCNKGLQDMQPCIALPSDTKIAVGLLKVVNRPGKHPTIKVSLARCAKVGPSTSDKYCSRSAGTTENTLTSIKSGGNPK